MPQTSPMNWMIIALFPTIIVKLLMVNNQMFNQNKMEKKFFLANKSFKWKW